VMAVPLSGARFSGFFPEEYVVAKSLEPGAVVPGSSFWDTRCHFEITFSSLVLIIPSMLEIGCYQPVFGSCGIE